MSKSTYYYEISKIDVVEERNKEIMILIKKIFEEHKCRYGVRRVHRELLNLGYKINHKRVQRLMNKMGLLARRPKSKYRSYKGEIGKVAKNIINRDFNATAPLQKWSTDISEFSFKWGKCYFSPILDMYNNEIISYHISLSPNLELVSTMLKKASKKFPNIKKLIFHSDQGWHYQHNHYINELKKHNITQSMSRKGNCYDNSIIETFFARLKVEMYYGEEYKYKSFEEFSKAIKEYIEYYNNKRIQAKTKWMPPVKYRETSISIV